MPATSKTTVRMWNKEGYHKDIAILDSDQVLMTEGRAKEPGGDMLYGIGIGSSLVFDPSEFPEAVWFQIIVTEYPRR